MPDSHPMSASVIVPTFNRKERLERLVRAVLSDQAADELVVVVDGSHDGSYELLRAIARSEPRLTPMFVPNGGEGAARQLGAEAATGEVLVVLDDDLMPGPGLIAGHVARHRGREKQVVLGYMPTTLPSPRQPGQFATVLYAREYEAEAVAWEEDPTMILTSLWGGNLSIRKADAMAVGFESLGGQVPYHSDQGFGLRCRDAGMTGVFDRSLLAWHEHERSLDQFISDAKRQARGSLMIHHLEDSGPFPFSSEKAFPGAVRGMIRHGSHPLFVRLVIGSLRLAVCSAGRVGAFDVETYMAMILRQVVQRSVISALTVA